MVQAVMARHESHGPKHLAPTLEDIERLAGEAFATVPQELRRHVANVVFRVEDFPDETEQEMGLESPFDLLGLYRGVALPHQSATMLRRSNDMIFLYRRALLDYWCETGQPLFDIVRHVLIHEIGHHFGFSDDDMERIEAVTSEE
jgi:predicted Zn-dependent protease with MMP-like domain